MSKYKGLVIGSVLLVLLAVLTTTPSASAKALFCAVAFNDKDGSKVQDSGEPGLAGFTFMLKGMYDLAWFSEKVVTDDSGLACFAAPTPGAYTLYEDGKPPGWVPTTPTFITLNFKDFPKEPDIIIDFAFPFGNRLTPGGFRILLPDLVPVSPPGSVNFCDIGTNKPVVRVQNNGGADANFAVIPGVFRLPAVRLDFETLSGTETKFLPPSVDVIPKAGGFDDIGPIMPPTDCFNPDCNFKITVNPGKPIGIPPSLIEIPPIPESNTANNIAFGSCIG